MESIIYDPHHLLSNEIKADARGENQKGTSDETKGTALRVADDKDEGKGS